MSKTLQSYRFHVFSLRHEYLRPDKFLEVLFGIFVNIYKNVLISNFIPSEIKTSHFVHEYDLKSYEAFS